MAHARHCQLYWGRRAPAPAPGAAGQRVREHRNRAGGGSILTGQDLIRAGSAAGRWGLSRPPHLFETSMPGVFAVGDVRHRSAKRVATAVGEGATAILLVHEYLSEPQAERARP